MCPVAMALPEVLVAQSQHRPFLFETSIPSTKESLCFLRLFPGPVVCFFLYLIVQIPHVTSRSHCLLLSLFTSLLFTSFLSLSLSSVSPLHLPRAMLSGYEGASRLRGRYSSSPRPAAHALVKSEQRDDPSAQGHKLLSPLGKRCRVPSR